MTQSSCLVRKLFISVNIHSVSYTHLDVYKRQMQHIFEKLGFKRVGKVPVDGERLAYQKLKK